MTPTPAPPGLPAAPEPSAVEMHLGWQYAAPQAEPGPPPRRPVPPERQQLSADWLAAQRREEKLISRPLKIGCAVGGRGADRPGGLRRRWLAARAHRRPGHGGLPGGRRADRVRDLAGRAGAAGQDPRPNGCGSSGSGRTRRAACSPGRPSTPGRCGEWQARRLAFESQKRWYAVPLPAGIDRVDVAGGTLPGWSALLTMIAAHQLAVGGEVTVLDLSGGAVAADLLRAGARRRASSPPSGCCPLTCRGSTSPRR